MNQANSRTISLGAATILVCTLLHACSGPLVSKSSDKKAFDSGITAGVEAGRKTTLTVTTGSLAGTTVEFADGSLPLGSQVNLQNALAPNEFRDINDVIPASGALSINAVAPDGTPIYELDAAMTVQLPITPGLTLTSATDRSQQLCVFLKTARGELFVWRRQAIRLANNRALFESNRLGTYQLVYCGNKALANFEDATTADIAGSASRVLATFVIPDGNDIDAEQYCVGVAGNLNEYLRVIEGDDVVIFGFQQQLRSKNGGTEIPVRLNPGTDLLQRSGDELAYFFIFFQSKDGRCELNGTSEDDHEVTGHNLLMAFRRDLKQAQDGNLRVILGDGGFAYERKPLRLGKPAGRSGNVAASFASESCLRLVTPGQNEGGLVEHRVNLETNNHINGSSSFETYAVATGSVSASELNIALNSSGCEEDIHFSSRDNSPNQRYLIRAGDFYNASEPVYLAPTSMTFANTAGVPIPGVNQVCVRVFDPSRSDPKNLTESQQQEQALAQFIVKTDGTTTYPIYLPFFESYHLFYRGVGEDQSCTEAGVVERSVLNNELNANIQVSVEGP